MSTYSDRNVNVSNGCNYANLSNYNNGSVGGMNTPGPVGGVTGLYVVPAYGSIGYNALTMGGYSCSGYATIGPAYNSNGGDCNTQYVKKLCQ